MDYACDVVLYSEFDSQAALDAYATLLGIEAQDREHFAKVTHDNFGSIFSKADATSEQVLAATLEVMSRDAQLARYVKQPA